VRRKPDLIEAHLLECHKRLVLCPNNCLNQSGFVSCIGLNEIEHHCTLCNLETIGCKFAPAGCKIKLSRKDMPLHEENTGAHVNCLLLALQGAQVALQRAHKRIMKLAEFTQRAQETISDLGGSQQILEEEVEEIIFSLDSDLDQVSQT
jgi:hypothetical protein